MTTSLTDFDRLLQEAKPLEVSDEFDALLSTAVPVEPDEPLTGEFAGATGLPVGAADAPPGATGGGGRTLLPEDTEGLRPFDPGEIEQRGFEFRPGKQLNRKGPRPSVALNASKAALNGLATGLGSLPQGIAIAAKALADTFPRVFPEDADRDVQDYVTFQWGQRLIDFADEHFQVDPELRGDFLVDVLPHGAAYAATFFAGGAATAALKGSGLAAVAVMGSSLEGSAQFRDAKASGASDDDAMKAAGLGAVVGLSEVVPISRIFRRFDKASGGQFKKAAIKVVKDGLADGSVEVVQEVFQTAAGNAIAQSIYDKERRLVDGLVESGGAGGIIGTVSSIIAQIVGGRRGRVRLRKIADSVDPNAKKGQKGYYPSKSAEFDELLGKDNNREQRRQAALEADESLPTLGEEVAGPTLAEETSGGIVGVGAPAQLAEQQESETDVPVIPGQPDVQSFVNLDEVAKMGRSGLDQVGSFIKRFFTKEGHLPDSVFASKVRRDGKIKASVRSSVFAVSDLNKALKPIGGKSSLTDDDVRTMNSVLRGETSATEVPEEIREPLAAMRAHVDALSTRLIDVGAVEGPLSVQIAENRGAYLNTSYRVFDDPKWSKSVPQDIRNKAKAFLRAETPTATEDEIEGEINKLLFKGEKSPDSPIAAINSGQLGRKNLSILKKKKVIPEEIRQLWGEYKDPWVNYSRSVDKMSKMIANHEFLAEVRDAGLDKFFFVNSTGQHFAEIAEPLDSPMAPLNGLHTTPEIKRAFERATKPEALPRWFELYMKGNSGVKFSKTVLSEMTHTRNFLSNLMFQSAQGHWRVWNTWQSGSTLVRSATNSTDEQFRKDLLKYIRLGVVGDTARAGELKGMLKDAGGMSSDDFADRVLSDRLRKASKGAARIAAEGKRAVGGTLRATTALYQAEDDFWKIYAFENESARYRKALPELSDSEIDRIAATIVRNTMPTYSNVPEAIQRLRRFPLMGTFVSFPWEVGRVTYNTIDLISTELQDPQLRGIGAQRLAGSIATAAIVPAATALWRFMNGVTKDEDEKLRNFMPPWSQDSDIIHLGKDENGDYGTIDIGYIDPFAQLRKPIKAFMRGENWHESVFNAVARAAEPFLGEEILAGKLIDIARNSKKDTGGKIFNEQADGWTQLQQKMTYLYEGAFEPGTITSWRRIAKGLRGYVDPWGKTFDPKTESLALFTGNRLSKVNVPEGLAFRADRFKSQTRGAVTLLGRVAKSRGEVSDEELKEAYDAMEVSRRQLFDEMHELSNDAIALGMTDKDVRRVLRSRGVSKDDAKRIIDGSYRPYKPSSQFLKTAEKKTAVGKSVPASEFRRRRKLIRGFAKEAKASNG